MTHLLGTWPRGHLSILQDPLGVNVTLHSGFFQDQGLGCSQSSWGLSMLRSPSRVCQSQHNLDCFWRHSRNGNSGFEQQRLSKYLIHQHGWDLKLHRRVFGSPHYPRLSILKLGKKKTFEQPLLFKIHINTSNMCTYGRALTVVDNL